ncbi:MAG: ATP-binding protein [Spirochaetes bacterium]|nr:ATP-binding protein [Spirochaetota bacterium]
MHYTISDYIQDIVENALEAGSVYTTVEIQEQDGFLTVRVADTGKGMSPEEVTKALDPYGTSESKHPNRKVGLGLPFLVQCIESLKGEFHIHSEPGKGTSVYFRVPLTHIDAPPIGNLAETFRQILTYPGTHEIRIRRSRDKDSYTLLRSELWEALGDLESVGSQALLKEYLESQESALITEGVPQ